MDTVSARELRLWPLVHGPSTSYVHVNARELGLHAPGARRKGSNTFWYDEALGRNNYVFLTPARVRGGYGFGSFFLVDPVILKELGCRFFLRDIGYIVQLIPDFLDDSQRRFPDWVQRPALLIEMILAERARIKEELQKQSVPSHFFDLLLIQKTQEQVVGSEKFNSYLGTYELDMTDFFNAIEEQCAELGYTISMYLQRGQPEWPLDEEILVPGKVEPKNLLGYWDGKKWTEWASANNRKCVDRIERLVSKLSTAQYEAH